MNGIKWKAEITLSLVLYIVTLIVGLTTGYVTLSQDIRHNRETLASHIEEAKMTHSLYLRADVYDARQKAVERRIDDMISDLKDIQKSLRDLRR